MDLKMALDCFKLEKASDLNWRESTKLGNMVLASSVVAPDAAAIAKTALDRFKLEKANDINWRESRKLGNLVLDSSVVAPDAAAIAKTALDRLKLGACFQRCRPRRGRHRQNGARPRSSRRPAI